MQLRTAFLTADDSGDGELSLKEVRKNEKIKYDRYRNRKFGSNFLSIVYCSVR